jgi:tRNA-uridine 2-sulfurtransferase
MSQPKTVVVGLSGGVDSAVSAYLLKEQGYRVVGIFMKNWEDDDDSEYCSTRQDFLDAAAVADVLGIELQAVNFAAEYKDRVFAEFLREYQAGRTPNPDVLCNAEIKFKAFLDYAFAQGADLIATGHYARVRRRHDGLVELLRGLDESKDQSYFLHRLSQAQLDRVLFPVGEIKKTQVRQIAEQIGLPNAKKKDSTGICFIGERPFREFLNRYLTSAPGSILTPDSPGGSDQPLQIGSHQGLSFYTLGQSKGLGIGGVREAGFVSQEGKSWFVCRKDVATNTLYVSQNHDHPWLMSDGLTTVDACWVSGSPPDSDQVYGLKTRYRQADAAGWVAPAGDRFSVKFGEPQWAATPGQSVVVYRDEVCLGGGIIAEGR